MLYLELSPISLPYCKIILLNSTSAYHVGLPEESLPDYSLTGITESFSL